MPETTSSSSNTKVMFLGALAAIGWALALYFGVNGSRAEDRLGNQIATLE